MSGANTKQAPQTIFDTMAAKSRRFPGSSRGACQNIFAHLLRTTARGADIMRAVHGLGPMRVKRSVIAASALILSLSLAPRALADPTAEDRAAADVLFREGRALIKQGKYAPGCSKLVASQELDPTAGTLLALADCYELNGETASAWATFNDAEAMARKAGDRRRSKEAARRAGLVEPLLSRLVIEVAPEARVKGLQVRRNTKPLDAALFGSAIPVDPGEHTIEAVAPGKKVWSAKVLIEPKAGQSTVRVPPLENAPAPEAPAARERAARAPAATGAAPAASSWSAQRTVGLVVLGGVSLAGLAVGAVFGVDTLLKMSEARDQHGCTNDDPPRCDAAGVKLHQDANTTANISNVAFAAGGAALITGLIVILTAPSSQAAPPTAREVRLWPAVGVGTAGMSLRGSF
ncbi:hypothetical protein [Sorangium sp. So ce1000]|uniref:hypothetical protein n=1 Tax=Sorangium sp. So ce1000 TaxID=3133325 RepID=UPI003F6302C0